MQPTADYRDDPRFDELMANLMNSPKIVEHLMWFLCRLMNGGFSGVVQLHFEGSNLVVVKKLETVKPEDLCRVGRRSYERNPSQ